MRKPARYTSLASTQAHHCHFISPFHPVPRLTLGTRQKAHTRLSIPLLVVPSVRMHCCASTPKSSHPPINPAPRGTLSKDALLCVHAHNTPSPFHPALRITLGKDALQCVPTPRDTQPLFSTTAGLLLTSHTPATIINAQPILNQLMSRV